MADHVEDTDDAIDEDWIDWYVDVGVDCFVGTLGLLMVVLFVALLMNVIQRLAHRDYSGAAIDAAGILLWVGVIVLRRSRKGRA